jgi:hypothetical protein
MVSTFVDNILSNDMLLQSERKQMILSAMLSFTAALMTERPNGFYLCLLEN